MRRGLRETARGFWGWECLRTDRGSLEVFTNSRMALSQEEILATVLHALLGCFSPLPATKSPQQAQLDPPRAAQTHSTRGRGDSCPVQQPHVALKATLGFCTPSLKRPEQCREKHRDYYDTLMALCVTRGFLSPNA